MRSARKAPRSLSQAFQPPEPVKVAAPTGAVPAQTRAKHPDEDDVVAVNTHVMQRDRHRLRQLALDRHTTVHDLVHRGLNLLLAEEGLPPLAPAPANPTSRRRKRP